MKVAAAESAVLDSAAQRGVNAAKQEKANADAAEMLAKEKRKVLDAMQEAKRLQAEANSKYEQAERLLAQFGLADVPPQPTTPQKGAEATPGRVRAMSAYQSNVKVEQLAEGGQARTPGSIVANSTTSIKIAEKAPPAPCSRMGAMHKTRARRLRRLFMPSATSIQARA